MEEKQFDAAEETADTAAEPAEGSAPVDEDAAELAETKEKYLRMLAEYDNYRKRTQRERECAYGDGMADAIAEFLPVLDNLERAAQTTENAALAEGLALTLKQANATLTKLGVEETARVGDTFDPNIHQAVSHIEDDAAGEGEILEVFQRGYRRGDKMIRCAMVKVAN